MEVMIRCSSMALLSKVFWFHPFQSLWLRSHSEELHKADTSLNQIRKPLKISNVISWPVEPSMLSLHIPRM